MLDTYKPSAKAFFSKWFILEYVQYKGTFLGKASRSKQKKVVAKIMVIPP